MSLQKVRLS